VAQRLVFTGVVPRTEVPAAAMAFDIALQTALVPYASPLCLFEYMALGKVILAPDQANHHEVLDKGVDCEMYDPDAPGSIETRLDALMADPQRRAELGAAAKRTLQTRQFVWDGNARRVAAEATSLVGAKPAHP
jgi:glycosyltransferase involved in cell wall biosynthesis